jgi:hypothetical protein
MAYARNTIEVLNIVNLIYTKNYIFNKIGSRPCTLVTLALDDI